MSDVIPPCGLQLNPTAQQVFDRVATHLLTQQKMSGKVDHCYYRKDGLSCAVGCLIPDEVYAAKMEGLGIAGLRQNYQWFGDVGLSPHEGLLRALQIIHDDVPVTGWLNHLQYLARSQGLNELNEEVLQ